LNIEELDGVTVFWGSMCCSRIKQGREVWSMQCMSDTPYLDIFNI
jgi:hypothetical protein